MIRYVDHKDCILSWMNLEVIPVNCMTSNGFPDLGILLTCIECTLTPELMSSLQMASMNRL